MVDVNYYTVCELIQIYDEYIRQIINIPTILSKHNLGGSYIFVKEMRKEYLIKQFEVLNKNGKL